MYVIYVLFHLYITSFSIFFFFFFSCYGDHRDLHSFPTRRSSDLERDRLPASPCGREDRIGETRLESVTSCDRAQRSEEHTSELQSPDHLVCRLLLEKKKKQTQHPTQTSPNHDENIRQLLSACRIL